MKKIDITKAKDLKSLKEALNSIFDRNIEQLMLNENIENLDKNGFNCLKYLFETVSGKLYESKNGKSIIKSYVQTIKESKDLCNLYKLSTLIANGNSCSNQELFLNESLSMFTVPNKRVSLKKLSNVVKEAIKEANITNDELDTIMENYKGSINESLDFITSNKKSVGNITEYVNNLSSVIEYLNENKKEVSVNEGTKTTKDLINQYTELLSDKSLNEWQVKAIKDITMCNLSGKSKKDLFEDYKKECIDYLSELLEEGTTEDVSEISLLKEKLEKHEYSEENINEDIMKMAEMKTLID